MSERQLKQLVGALAIAAAVWAVSLLFSSRSGGIVATGAIARVFDGVDASSVRRVQIVTAGTSVDLARSGDSWTANGFPADPAAVTRLLEVLPDLEIGDLTATNPSNHARMGVASGSATAVTFTLAEGERAILVGKGGQRFGTAYVRLPDSDEVYLMDGDLLGQTARSLDQWRDRTMIALDTAAVARVEVVRRGERYTLMRGDSTWTLEGGPEAQASAVSGVLAELSSLVATGFLAEGDSIAGLDLEATTRAFSENGDLLGVITVGAGEGDRWARTTTDEYVYRVSSFRAGRIAPAREDVEPSG